MMDVFTIGASFCLHAFPLSEDDFNNIFSTSLAFHFSCCIDLSDEDLSFPQFRPAPRMSCACGRMLDIMQSDDIAAPTLNLSKAPSGTALGVNRVPWG